MSANLAFGQVFTLSIVIAVFYSADNIAIDVDAGTAPQKSSFAEWFRNEAVDWLADGKGYPAINAH